MKTTAPPPVRETVAAPAPPAPAPQLIERLQRSAGNRAVTAFLQRQPVETKEHLSAGQAAHAVAFYTGRPELYPADVIVKIQKAVGSPQTGVADTEMAQAVADWQFPQSLKPDGMAGPRTLPRMFESGLAEKKSREAVVKTTEAVQTRLEGPQDRRGARRQALRGRQGPARGGAASSRRPSTRSRTSGRSSACTCPRTGRSTSTTTRSPPPTSTTTVHETLQAPSTTRPGTPSRATRWRACSRPRSNTPEQISAKMDLPIDVATGAHANPLPKGVEFATASQQFDSVYGPGKAQHEKAERRGGDVRRAAGGQAGRGRQPDTGQQGALPAAGRRVPRLPRPARPRTTRSAPRSPSRRAGTRPIPKKPCC